MIGACSASSARATATLESRTTVKAAVLKLVAAFTHHGDRIDWATNAAADLGKVGQDRLQVGLRRRKLGGQQLVGQRAWQQATPDRLALKALVGVGSDVDYAVTRGHRQKPRARHSH